MRITTLRRVRWWLFLIDQALKSLAIGLSFLAGVVVLGAIIFWDADMYAARDRLEHMKIAWFGKWPENNHFRWGRKKEMVICHWGADGTVGVCILSKPNKTKKQTEKEQ